MRGLFFIVSFTFSIPLFSQGIYNSLNVNNFRNYKPFNDTIDINTFKPELLNAAVFFVTNEVRIKHKLSFLKYNAALEATAKMHSEDMAKYGFLDHVDKKNRKHKEPEDRASLSGIANPHIAENIIEGFLLSYKSGEEVIVGRSGEFYRKGETKPIAFQTYLSLADDLVSQWMASPGHRANILAKDAVELGCGCAIYAMKDFNNMPAIKATQNFQWFTPVILK